MMASSDICKKMLKQQLFFSIGMVIDICEVHNFIFRLIIGLVKNPEVPSFRIFFSL